MSRPQFLAQPLAAVGLADLHGTWQVDEAATVAAEAERLGVPADTVRAELAALGLIGVTLRFTESSFVLQSPADSAGGPVPVPQAATYRQAEGIPCAANELWVQFTWDDMMAQPFQYLLVALSDDGRLQIEWPNDQVIQYRRAAE